MSTEPIAAQVVAALTVAGQSLATAESLTGGLIGAAITDIPGASAVYRGGVISYATAMKSVLAQVPEQLLAAVGPVAEQTACAMAQGVQTLTGADWAVAVTGVAGPDGQDGHAPGEVWVGLADPDRLARATRFDFDGSRTQVRRATVEAALHLVLNRLAGVSITD